VITGFLSLIWWQMPIAIAGLLLLISGPSMIMAWFKLRQRNLSPILDANGWAINTRARVNLPFGRSLTSVAVLPEGSRQNLSDPYAERSNAGWWILAILALGLVWAVSSGHLAPDGVHLVVPEATPEAAPIAPPTN